MEPKKPITTRRVWRMTADNPHGEFLELVPKAAVYPTSGSSAAPHAEQATESEALQPGTLKRTFHPETVARPERTAPADATGPALAEHPMEAPAKVLTPAKVPSWRASSYDLMTGLTVRDVSDTIPGDIFDELFEPKPPSLTPSSGRRR